MKKTIWAHTLVKNEERYLWYAVKSVIEYVDKILIWDTGSSDNTVEIIKKLHNEYRKKIIFKEVGEVDIEEFTKMRQKMLDQTKSDWVFILDGDEVWWEDSIKRLTQLIQSEGNDLESIVSPCYNIVGDIYHYQEESAGKYEIDGKIGHLNIRAINRRIPGLHLEKPHGQQGFYDGEGTLIQERDKELRKFLDAPYLHFTNMIRSSSTVSDRNVPKRSFKFKYEIGIPFAKGFKYPEVLYKKTPDIIPSPWEKMPNKYFLRAIVETKIKKIKRRLLKSGRVGY